MLHLEQSIFDLYIIKNDLLDLKLSHSFQVDSSPALLVRRGILKQSSLVCRVWSLGPSEIVFVDGLILRPLLWNREGDTIKTLDWY